MRCFVVQSDAGIFRPFRHRAIGLGNNRLEFRGRRSRDLLRANYSERTLKHGIRFVLPMVGRRTLVASALILVLILPMAASTLVVNEGRGGYDADGVWTESVELPLHHEWWLDWSRDKDHDAIDDRLEWLLEQPVDFQEDWWRRAPAGHARVFINYDHHPSDADVSVLESMGVIVTFRATYLDTLAASIPLSLIHI